MKKKVLFIIPPERFNEEEVIKPNNILVNKGMAVVISSMVTGETTGDYDGTVISAAIFSNLY